MNRYEKLMKRITNGDQILLDGATGTELEERDVPMVDDGWNGGAVLTHPNTVRAVHEDYIQLGADIVIANTFSSSRYVLQDAGLEEHFEHLNRHAVELAIEARSNTKADNVLVAGGIATTTFTGNYPPHDVMQRNFEEQADIMAKAGADLIMLEMMKDIEQTKITLAAAQKTGLPVWMGISCQQSAQGVIHMFGYPDITLVEWLDAFNESDFPLLSVMHTDVSIIDECLDIVQNCWSLPIGVYAQSGDFINNNWVFTDTISPEAYATAAVSWAKRGVQMLGGCCGVGLGHMEVMYEQLRQSQ